MRITPALNVNSSFVNKTLGARTKFESKNAYNQPQNNKPHQYTGVASADLAYASMFDNAIARDLKLMGLI